MSTHARTHAPTRTHYDPREAYRAVTREWTGILTRTHLERPTAGPAYEQLLTRTAQAAALVAAQAEHAAQTGPDREQARKYAELYRILEAALLELIDGPPISSPGTWSAARLPYMGEVCALALTTFPEAARRYAIRLDQLAVYAEWEGYRLPADIDGMIYRLNLVAHYGGADTNGTRSTTIHQEENA